MLDQLERLKNTFGPHTPQSRAYDIIVYMVEKTLEQLQGGTSTPAPFTRENFIAACEKNPESRLQDPNKWAPKTPALEAALQLLQRDLPPGPRLGLHEQKQVGGGRGKVNQYWLTLAEAEAAPKTEKAKTVDLDISYRQTDRGEVKPSLCLRWLFRDGELRTRSRKGIMFLGTLFLLSGTWILMYATSVLGLYLSHEPATMAQLTSLVFVSLCFAFVWRYVYHPWWQLIDHRVILAPGGAAALLEDPCQLEMYRRDSEKWIRLVRFSADCPLCGGTVELAKGRPDHRQPLVGRCQESPHYHVFSFDRSHQAGTYIGPPLPAALRARI